MLYIHLSVNIPKPQTPFKTATLPKFNMEPKNGGFQRNLLFQGAIFRFHVKLWEGKQNYPQTLELLRKHEPSSTMLCIPLNLIENNCCFQSFASLEEGNRKQYHQNSHKIFSRKIFPQSLSKNQAPSSQHQTPILQNDPLANSHPADPSGQVATPRSAHDVRFGLQGFPISWYINSAACPYAPKIVAWSTRLGCSPVTVIAKKKFGVRASKNHFAKKISYHREPLWRLKCNLQVNQLPLEV